MLVYCSHSTGLACLSFLLLAAPFFAHVGKVIQTPTLEAFPSSSWACILVNMCLIPALCARGPGLCLQGISGTTPPFISLAKPSWCVNLFQLWITHVFTIVFLPVFYHLTAFTCYLKSQLNGLWLPYCLTNYNMVTGSKWPPACIEPRAQS